MNHTIEFVARDHSGITTIVTEHGVTDIHAAIADIQDGRSTYLAGPSSFERARVRILTALGEAYLYANWDGSKRNNLHDLAHQMTRPVRVHSARGQLVWRSTGILRSALAAFRPHAR